MLARPVLATFRFNQILIMSVSNFEQAQLDNFNIFASIFEKRKIRWVKKILKILKKKSRSFFNGQNMEKF